MSNAIVEAVQGFLRDEEGASAIEYGLIVGLIAVALIGVLTIMSGSLGNLFTAASNELSDAAANAGT